MSRHFDNLCDAGGDGADMNRGMFHVGIPALQNLAATAWWCGTEHSPSVGMVRVGMTGKGIVISV